MYSLTCNISFRPLLQAQQLVIVPVNWTVLLLFLCPNMHLSDILPFLSGFESAETHNGLANMVCGNYSLPSAALQLQTLQTLSTQPVTYEAHRKNILSADEAQMNYL